MDVDYHTEGAEVGAVMPASSFDRTQRNTGTVLDQVSLAHRPVVTPHVTSASLSDVDTMVKNPVIGPEQVSIPILEYPRLIVVGK